MYWTQDESAEDLPVPAGVVDLLFAIDCREIPVDHAYALGEALCRAVPWLADEPQAAIHDIHVAGSQNGWERPVHAPGNLIRPSRRTKLAVRTPQARAGALLAELPGRKLEIAGHPLAIGPGKVRPLSKETTLIARHVVGAADEDEGQFLERCARDLARMDIRVRKALCGKATELASPSGPMLARSLLLASLTLAESLRLQQQGLGPKRLHGCGIFIPHKGIEAVTQDR